MLTVTAHWIEPARRADGLSHLHETRRLWPLEMLEGALRPDSMPAVGESIKTQLAASITTDIAELLPHLNERGEEARKDAQSALDERGHIEAGEIRRILEEQKKRVLAELGKSIDTQLSLFDTAEERRQYESNRRYWQRWIENVDGDLATEPGRILDFYRTSSYRIEAIGIAYLVPQDT